MTIGKETLGSSASIEIASLNSAIDGSTSDKTRLTASTMIAAGSMNEYGKDEKERDTKSDD